MPVSLCDIDTVHNQGVDPAASPGPALSSSREYFPQPLRNDLVFTRPHHPDRYVEQALASTGNGDRWVTLHQFLDDVSSFELERILGPCQAQMRHVIGDWRQVAIGRQTWNRRQQSRSYTARGYPVL